MVELKFEKDGTFKHNGKRYKAIKELSIKLTAKGIPHEMHVMFDGYQICVPAEHEPCEFDGDAVQHCGSWGAEQDLIEIWGFDLEEPIGHLTADEALKYFVKWYKEKLRELNTHDREKGVSKK